MMKSQLDMRICDCEAKATNTETYRAFIVNGLRFLYGDNTRIPNLDEMCEEEINELIDDIDYLLEK